ncbi:MAG: aminotransferase class I/II-fold pyridoxal phosphate-dependent enzyme [Candidatus Altiarchaeales archaeon]|nr:aminotransferase class I/II-fold pyridoxal phosphate-dependent enzyme [Candidatus Altiarchaeales archaeon]MBD3415638.1 aminotransferase class I/II-fold pyridoxal phosphate-dependent enzyme [Candidatus Altiarchaeales archaeon]
MVGRKISWWDPEIGDREYELVRDVLARNFPNEGRVARQLEERASALIGSKHAVTSTNGTSALYMALKAVGVGVGDEVIVPDLTFIATANAVDMCGAKPVLVDVEPDSMNMGVESFTNAITEKTKAVIPVHVSGRSADIEAICDAAGEKGIHVIEDAAEAFMSKKKGRCLGTFGVCGCYSFSPNKIVTSGQGGLVVTDDEEVDVRLRMLKDQGRPKRGTGGDDIHESIGYNFKFTDIQAAVAVGQLEYLEERMKRLRRNHELYVEHLSGLDGVRLYEFDLGSGELPLWTDIYSDRRDELDEYLMRLSIDCRRLWHPLHMQEPYRMPSENFPNSLDCSRNSIWLPSAYNLSDDDVLRVCESIRRFISGQ